MAWIWQGPLLRPIPWDRSMFFLTLQYSHAVEESQPALNSSSSHRLDLIPTALAASYAIRVKKAHSPSAVTQATLPQPGTHSNTVTNNSEHATLEPTSIHLVLGQGFGKRPHLWLKHCSESLKQEAWYANITAFLSGSALWWTLPFTSLSLWKRSPPSHKCAPNQSAQDDVTPQVLLTLQLWKSLTTGLRSHALAAPDLGQAVPTFLYYPQALATLFPEQTQPPAGQKATHSLLVLPV